jgi:hypothetical protein
MTTPTTVNTTLNVKLPARGGTAASACGHAAPLLPSSNTNMFGSAASGGNANTTGGARGSAVTDVLRASAR